MRNETLGAILPYMDQLRLFILLGDLGVYQCKDIFSKYPDRILNFGIMEQSMIGVAAGLSSSGMYPLVYSIAPFLIDRAYEQIKLDLVYNDNPCLLVSAGASYDYSKLGPTHYCPHDISSLLLIGFPRIHLPLTASDALRALDLSVKSRSLSYLRLSSSTLSFVDYPWLTRSSVTPETSSKPLKLSTTCDAVQHWKSCFVKSRALVVVSPDSQYLPSYRKLVHSNCDIICITEISATAIDCFSSICSSYDELDLLLPFESSTLIEKLIIGLAPHSCRLNIHTITNQYSDSSGTKEAFISRYYVNYSVITS